MEVHLNWLALVVASLVPMVVGFIYYHPALLGGIWMRANGFTMESLGNGPKPILYAVAWALSFMLAFWCRVQFLDPHQTSIDFEGQPHDWVTFGHGAAHGLIYSLLLVLPILGTSAIFEKRSMSWVLVNWGYWAVTLIGMCAIVCGWR